MIFRTVVLVLLSTVVAIAGPLEQAVELIDDGEYSQAIPFLEQPAKNCGTEAEAVLLLTQAYNELGDWESGVKREDVLAAINVSKEIPKRYPDNLEIRLAFGQLLQQEKRFEEADVQFAILAESDDAETRLGALYQRGRSRVLGKYESDQAIEMFETFFEQLEKGFSRLPSEAAARWRMGMAFENLGQFEAARQSFEWALRLDPDLKEAGESLSELKKKID